MAPPKTGPLTRDELMTLWQSVTSREYNRPLLENSESLIEVIEQAADQFARASEAIDRNHQALYILPWSGQSNDPASGFAKATTTIRITRTKRFDIPIVLLPGHILFEQHLDDFGEDGPLPAFTGRRYAVTETFVLGMGEATGTLTATAERPGFGYNIPPIGSINKITQRASSFNNAGASVALLAGDAHDLKASTSPDVPIPDHVGQYYELVAGANAGRVVRITGYQLPDPNAVPFAHGGVAKMAADGVLQIGSIAGTFELGESVIQATTGAQGTFISQSGGKFQFVRTSGTFSATDVITGDVSGATVTPAGIDQSHDLIAELGTASWKVVEWVDFFGLTVENIDQPTGGKCGFLDELGLERGIQRALGEEDDSFRVRIATLADVVSPGAVTRACNRILDPLGLECCLREVGRDLFQGMFYDGQPTNEPFAYDLDLVTFTGAFTVGSNFIEGEKISAVNTTTGIYTVGRASVGYASAAVSPPEPPSALEFKGVVDVRGPGFSPGDVLVGEVSGAEYTVVTASGGLLPEHRFNVYLDLLEFRGFFLIGVPPIRLQDFGIFYDDGLENTFDVQGTSFTNFYDGTALGTNAVYAQLYESIRLVKAAGVGFDLYLEDYGCV